MRIYVSHQEQSEKKQEEINKILKKIIIVYTKSHDLSSPNGLRAFVEHLTQAYNLAVVSVEEGSLVLTVRCPNLESLERLWNDYQSGCLNDIVEVLLLTNDIKSELNLDNARFKIAIGKENYLMCKKALSGKLCRLR